MATRSVGGSERLGQAGRSSPTRSGARICVGQILEGAVEEPVVDPFPSLVASRRPASTRILRWRETVGRDSPICVVRSPVHGVLDEPAGHDLDTVRRVRDQIRSPIERLLGEVLPAT